MSAVLMMTFLNEIAGVYSSLILRRERSEPRRAREARIFQSAGPNLALRGSLALTPQDEVWSTIFLCLLGRRTGVA